MCACTRAHRMHGSLTRSAHQHTLTPSAQSDYRPRDVLCCAGTGWPTRWTRRIKQSCETWQVPTRMARRAWPCRAVPRLAVPWPCCAWPLPWARRTRGFGLGALEKMHRTGEAVELLEQGVLVRQRGTRPHARKCARAHVHTGTTIICAWHSHQHTHSTGTCGHTHAHVAHTHILARMCARRAPLWHTLAFHFP
jgi:hypothetical protein